MFRSSSLFALSLLPLLAGAQIQCPSYTGYASAAITKYITCYGEYAEVTVTGENAGGYFESLTTGAGSWFSLGAPVSLTADTYRFTFFTNNQSCTIDPGQYCYRLCEDNTQQCCEYRYEPYCVCTSSSGTHTQTITIPDVPCTLGPAITVTPPSAYGCADGSITYSATTSGCSGYGFLLGGAPPESFQWFYHASGQGGTIHGLREGTYDAHFEGCTSSVQDVTVPAGPCTITASATHTDPGSVLCADGSIQVTADRGASCLDLYAVLEHDGGVYDMRLLEGGSGTAVFTDLPPGTHQAYARLGDNSNTACQFAAPVQLEAPACAFPFTLAAIPMEYIEGLGCANGGIRFTNTTSCTVYMDLYDRDTMPHMGGLSFPPGTTELQGGGFPADGACLLRAYNPNVQDPDCVPWAFLQIPCAGAPAVQVRCWLEGAYRSSPGLMVDALRTLPGFPVSDPYPALGYVHVGGAAPATLDPALLAATGADALVDWVVVELRDAATPALVVASRPALLQRDGDVVAPDGSTPLTFTAAAGNYHVAVRHRNHLGVMTAGALALGGAAIAVDFTSPALATYGTNARKAVAGTQVLWAGDVTFNGRVQYTGTGNDRDRVLLAIGGTVPTNTTTGYLSADVNLDGTVKYTGTGNDRDPILVTIGGTVPTNVRVQQLP